MARVLSFLPPEVIEAARAKQDGAKPHPAAPLAELVELYPEHKPESAEEEGHMGRILRRALNVPKERRSLLEAVIGMLGG